MLQLCRNCDITATCGITDYDGWLLDPLLIFWTELAGFEEFSGDDFGDLPDD